MPLAALLLVLGAALCHSAWNLLVKTDARRLEIQSGALIVGVLLCSPVLLIDRKSTRLNSSHVAMSYAVFCLKKKREISSDMLCTWMTNSVRAIRLCVA